MLVEAVDMHVCLSLSQRRECGSHCHAHAQPQNHVSDAELFGESLPSEMWDCIMSSVCCLCRSTIEREATLGTTTWTLSGKWKLTKGLMYNWMFFSPTHPPIPP